jgi:hypothetical protein
MAGKGWRAIGAGQFRSLTLVGFSLKGSNARGDDGFSAGIRGGFHGPLPGLDP